ncbi:hypothetical protein G647_03742 [Cladophialophora carrionii CBS 160.54]|uniref:Stress response protein YvgO n=1 Tax=Cladophialophora carrionii CBS 160.54 TaxID=1279043 RepID=V9DDI9_9EURO|nr:uncharacterized protein G647_03742 [Cladophialophora carrionii CBS 160.54]ETI24373.1 hypothetical protein G647_03742 [Cladophialophora carrionii CBS 160.54]
MHLSSFLYFLAWISTFFGTCISAPTKNVHHPARPVSEASVDRRQLQVLVDVAVIITAAETVIEGIQDLIDLIDGDIEEAEGQFTRGIVSNLRDQYPTMNVLVYHNQDCGYDLYDATHAHVEFDIALGFTKGYEVWVFDHGTFNLVGDGGYQNWAIGGSFEGPSSEVTFYSMNGN